MRNKMRIGVVLIMMTFLFSGCIKKVDNTVQNEVWAAVVDQEFRNYDVFAGSGLFFYEDHSFKYCTYKIYGSGVPIAFEHTSRVLIKENGIMQISLPKNFENGNDSAKQIKEESIYLELEYDQSGIKFGEHLYTLHNGDEVTDLSDYEIERINSILKKYKQGI